MSNFCTLVVFCDEFYGTTLEIRKGGAREIIAREARGTILSEGPLNPRPDGVFPDPARRCGDRFAPPPPRCLPK